MAKEQQVQRDVLEGWRTVETDSVDENTLLYRVGRIVWMRMKIAHIEDERTQAAIQQAPH